MNAQSAWSAWLLIGVLGCISPVWADCDNQGTPKAIGIEEPWLENAGYLFAKNFAGSPGSFALAPQADIRFSRWVGMEIDLPSWRVTGSRSSSHALGAGLKVPLIAGCQGSRSPHTFLTAEIEGQYSPQRAPILNGPGNSVTAQVEWAQGAETFYEGELGYTKGLGLGAISGWFLNTSVGRKLGKAVAIQLEFAIDHEDFLASGRLGLEGSILPQIAFHIFPSWLLALGEQIGWAQSQHKTQWRTWLMVEREFD